MIGSELNVGGFTLGAAPKFLYIQPSLRECVENSYPRLRHFMSDKFRKNETLIIVSDSNTSYVDKKGVLYVHPSLFDKIQSSIFTFFGECMAGSRIEDATENLMQRLQRSYDGGSSPQN